MRRTKEKKGFSTKTLIIIALVLVIVMFVLYFIYKNPAEKVMHCTMSLNDFDYADIDMTVDAYYTNYVNKVEGRIDYKITDDDIKPQINLITKTLTDVYDQAFDGHSSKATVTNTEDTVNIDFYIDYREYKDGDVKNFDIIGEVKQITIDEFKQNIENSGGTCVEG